MENKMIKIRNYNYFFKFYFQFSIWTQIVECDVIRYATFVIIIQSYNTKKVIEGFGANNVIQHNYSILVLWKVYKL